MPEKTQTRLNKKQIVKNGLEQLNEHKPDIDNIHDD